MLPAENVETDSEEARIVNVITKDVGNMTYIPRDDLALCLSGPLFLHVDASLCKNDKTAATRGVLSSQIHSQVFRAEDFSD